MHPVVFAYCQDSRDSFDWLRETLLLGRQDENVQTPCIWRYAFWWPRSVIYILVIYSGACPSPSYCLPYRFSLSTVSSSMKSLFLCVASYSLVVGRGVLADKACAAEVLSRVCVVAAGCPRKRNEFKIESSSVGSKIMCCLLKCCLMKILVSQISRIIFHQWKRNKRALDFPRDDRSEKHRFEVRS